MAHASCSCFVRAEVNETRKKSLFTPGAMRTAALDDFPLGDIEMTLTIEEQTDGDQTTDALLLLFRFHRPTLFLVSLPAPIASLDDFPRIYHINMVTFIHPHSLRTRQLCQILHPFHFHQPRRCLRWLLSSMPSHDDCSQVRNVESGLRIDEEITGHR